MRLWTAMLVLLPVVARYELSRYASLYLLDVLHIRVGARHPATSQDRNNKPICILTAYLARF